MPDSLNLNTDNPNSIKLSVVIISFIFNDISLSIIFSVSVLLYIFCVRARSCINTAPEVNRRRGQSLMLN